MAIMVARIFPIVMLSPSFVVTPAVGIVVIDGVVAVVDEFTPPEQSRRSVGGRLE